jgi:hypothetical protein
MKYTINEETKLIEVETTGTETVLDLLKLKFFALEEFEDFTIQFKAICETKQTMITDSGYVTDNDIKYVYSRDCLCGNCERCSCELKNK